MNAPVSLSFLVGPKPVTLALKKMGLGLYQTTSITSCHCSFSVSKSSLFWFTNAKVAFVTDAPARLGAGTSSILLGENATTLAGENAARWITASVDCPPFPATTEPLHIEVCTKMLVVRSSDAVVSDWQEVVEYG